MNRYNNTHFSKVPADIDIPRTRLDNSYDHKTTFNAGELIPIYCQEILPGSTVELKTNMIVRMSTPLFPVLDTAYLDTFFFFVPNRLLWEHWEAFNGQNDDTFWTQPVEYNVPQLTPPYLGWDKGSLADYFGYPTNLWCEESSHRDDISISALPFRGYVKIWNDWFRDTATMTPAYFTTDDSDRTGRRREDYNTIDGGIESALYGGRPLQASKLHDYFTSVLPEPQRGPAVSVPSNLSAAELPVIASGQINDPMYTSDGKIVRMLLGTNDSLSTLSGNFHVGLHGENLPNGTVSLARYNGTISSTGSPEFGSPMSYTLYPRNLNAMLPENSGVSLLVNDIRTAFQIQRIYEKDARGGTRYTEILKSHFGVDSPDQRLQRSEYLGGERVPININQVIQSSGTTSNNTPLGTAGAYSMTPSHQNSFIKSFTEHGWVIGLAVVRTYQSYQQGINRMWSRKRRFDFYWPALAHLGEQAVLKKEIFAPTWADAIDGEDPGYNDAFGYQEAWAEYRYKPSIVSGAFRSNYEGSLDAWHYANDFDGDLRTFVADADFKYQNRETIDRTLAVSSELEDQFIADFYFENYATLPMPLYSIPGLIDHY